jgi:hypothetical protein
LDSGLEFAHKLNVFPAQWEFAFHDCSKRKIGYWTFGDNPSPISLTAVQDFWHSPCQDFLQIEVMDPNLPGHQLVVHLPHPAPFYLAR